MTDCGLRRTQNLASYTTTGPIGHVCRKFYVSCGTRAKCVATRDVDFCDLVIKR